MDAIAAELGLDRAEVRERNFIRPDEMPYDHGLLFQDGRPLIYDSGDYPASMEKLKKLVGWDAFESYRAEARAQGRRVGIGLACYVEGTGVGPYEGGRVKVETDGSVVVATGLTTQGQGHQTAFAQIAADELGVPLDRVTVTTGDTRRFRYAVGTFASRALVMSGNAIAAAARKVREKALRIAGEALEADARDLEIVDGVVRVRGVPTSSIQLSTVAVLSNPLRYAFDEESAARHPVRHARRPGQTAGRRRGGAGPRGDRLLLADRGRRSPTACTRRSSKPTPTRPRSASSATASCTTAARWSTRGSSRDRSTAESHRAWVAPCTSGWSTTPPASCSTRRSWTSSCPTRPRCPTIETDHLETPSPLNPLGVKGAGEAGVIPGMAVFASAI